MARWQAALIGCGDIGTEHAEAAAGIDDLEFVTYCDLDLDRAGLVERDRLRLALRV